MGAGCDSPLGSWLGRWPVDDASPRSKFAFHSTLAQKLSLGRPGWSQTRSLENLTRQTFLGSSFAVGCASTVSTQNRGHCLTSSSPPRRAAVIFSGLAAWPRSQTLVPHYHRAHSHRRPGLAHYPRLCAALAN